MFDPGILEDLHPELRLGVVNALITLAETGVLVAQIEAQGSRLLAGSESQPADELAKNILSFRADVRMLQMIHDTGVDYAKQEY